MVRLDEDAEVDDFAKRAAACFEASPHAATYTTWDVAEGCLMGVRWGAGNDCVLVVRLDAGFEPTCYQGIVGSGATRGNNRGNA
jgi:hypothetical protein